MQRGQVDLCIVGTDRTTARGDVCNKIGTYLKALAAKDNGVPFYVALPLLRPSTGRSTTARDIPIEERSADEVLAHAAAAPRTARSSRSTSLPAGSPAATTPSTSRRRGWSPALITERGVCAASERACCRSIPEQARRRDPDAHGRASDDGPWLHPDRRLGHDLPDALGARPAAQDELGLLAELVFAGITVMFGVGALLSRASASGRPHRRAPPDDVGLADLCAVAGRHSPPARGPRATCLLGRHGYCLGAGAQHALQHRARSGRGTTRAPGDRLLTIIGGLASTVFWPLSGVLDAPWVGAARCCSTPPSICWLARRSTGCLPRRPPTHPVASGAAPAPAAYAPRIATASSCCCDHPRLRRLRLHGRQLQMIEILRGLGHRRPPPLLLASLIGPRRSASASSSWCSAIAIRS